MARHLLAARFTSRPKNTSSTPTKASINSTVPRSSVLSDRMESISAGMLLTHQKAKMTMRSRRAGGPHADRRRQPPPQPSAIGN